jgi:prepilin-type N-terminal cleavage/methylation domain-containing protein
MVYDKCMKSDTKRAFTIVELIIVITIIAILAVLSLVAYGGTKDRAYNVKLVNGVKQYYEAVETYKVKNGEYPKTSIERDNPSSLIAMTCLGVGYENNDCGVVTGTNISEDSHFNDQMSTLVETPPALGDLNLDVQPETFTGAVYGIDHTVTGSTGYGRTIQWAMLGTDADCQVSGAYSYNVSTTPATTACEILLEEITP